MKRLLLIVIGFSMLAGCGGVDWFPVTDPNAAFTVTVAATPNPSDTNPVSITATVKTVGGTPVTDGTPVSFTTNGGTLSTPSATTTGGVATVDLSSAIVGKFTVTASSTPVAGTLLVSFIPNVVLISTPPGNASPVVVRTTVTNPDGTPSSGQTVTYTITSGTGGSFSAPTAVTDGTGLALVNFNGTSGLTYTITATVSGATQTLSITLI